MTSMAANRSLSPWLVGLYLFVQIWGVVPLMNCQAVHAAAGLFAVSECKASSGALRHGGHYTGDTDDALSRHTLQDLNGVLGWLPERSEVALVHIAIVTSAPRALAEADPIRLERPPKAFLPI